eukprot:TRINITY_DN3040_c0_g3_i1.p1 TRINITY_DN3040_c0_g3~~TRINITY_DN3040_c0_g3_i1.p1  ORF type:complete len:459 (-),score=141.38 TRINITY_DN3040_c0_g3_i1:45-1421(-)
MKQEFLWLGPLNNLEDEEEDEGKKSSRAKKNKDNKEKKSKKFENFSNSPRINLVKSPRERFKLSRRKSEGDRFLSVGAPTDLEPSETKTPKLRDSNSKPDNPQTRLSSFTKNNPQKLKNLARYSKDITNLMNLNPNPNPNQNPNSSTTSSVDQNPKIVTDKQEEGKRNSGKVKKSQTRPEIATRIPKISELLDEKDIEDYKLERKREREKKKLEFSSKPTNELMALLQDHIYNYNKTGQTAQTNNTKCEEFSTSIKKIAEETRQLQAKKQELENRNIYLQNVLHERKKKVLAMIIALQNIIYQGEKQLKFLHFVESKVDKQIFLAYQIMINSQIFTDDQSLISVPPKIPLPPSSISTSSSHLFSLLGSHCNPTEHYDESSSDVEELLPFDPSHFKTLSTFTPPDTPTPVPTNSNITKPPNLSPPNSPLAPPSTNADNDVKRRQLFARPAKQLTKRNKL